MNCRSVAGFLFVMAVALFLRCGDLAERPLHNDEAINAFKLRELWTRGTYRYDPHEYHGPALYYLSLPALKVTAMFRPGPPDEAAMRTVAVWGGMVLIVLLFVPRRILGFGAVFFSGLLAAVSPVFVYFSRYYIHELLLVLAGALWLLGWQRMVRPGVGTGASGVGAGAAEPGPRRPGWAGIGWAAVAGLGLGLMWATKETFVLMLAAGFGAWILTVALPDGGASGEPGNANAVRRCLDRVMNAVRQIAWRECLVAVGVAGGVGGLLFSSFLAHPAGIVDSLRSYFIWGERAGGASPHVHPWSFFLERLLWYRWRGGPLWTEAFVVFPAAVGAVDALRGSRTWSREQIRVGRFLFFYAVLLGGVYSVIRYKTPWCVLGFYLPLLVLGGMGAATLGRRALGWGRWAGVVGGVILAGGTGHLAVQSWRASHEWASDFRNPWVYGHTSADVFNLLEQVREVTEVSEGKERTPLWVVAAESNYWPLPWYFRGRENVGWWDALPAGELPPMVVVASKLGLGLEEKTGRRWIQAGMFELRPRYFVELYVEAGLWQRFLGRRAAER